MVVVGSDFASQPVKANRIIREGRVARRVIFAREFQNGNGFFSILQKSLCDYEDVLKFL